VWKSAFKWWVWDESGNEYTDFTSGIFVANAGHGREEIIDAICIQSEDLIHSYAFPNKPREDLVGKLCEISGMDKVFLCSTGSEAIEAAIRCMQAFAGEKDIWRRGMWGLKGSFHGRTLGCKYINKWILPPIEYDGLTPRLPYFAKTGTGKPLGLFIEPYFGYNAHFHNKEWIQDLCGQAQEHNIPVCFDEVQAGFGRTGKMFGFEHYGVKPDLIVVGKALSGCLPISAVIGRADLLDAPDDLSSTHTGNPVCCAAALTNLKIIEDERLVERSASMEPVLRNATMDIQTTYPDIVSKVSGRGMVWALDLNDVDLANRVVDGCAEKGLLLVKTHRGTIKIGPPLITPKDVLVEGCRIIKEVLGELQT